MNLTPTSELPAVLLSTDPAYVQPDAHAHEDSHPRRGRVDLPNLAVIALPLIVIAVTMALLWDYAFGWTYLWLLAGFYVVTTLGITVGYHRLFTHRAFDTFKPIKAVLAVMGSMAVQGPLFKWVAWHRRHHQHSDHEGDPHSPHHDHGHGWKATIKGAFHAHVGWLIWPKDVDDSRYVGDLRKDKLLRVMSALFPLWVVLGLLLPAVLGGLFTMSWTGVLLGFIWGGVVRLLIVHHVTWSVNSICHLWGERQFRSNDESRNNVLVGVLGMGEGWHNTHHAFPTSARHGLKWWQLDVSYLLIRTLNLMGLAWNVRIPSADAIAAKSVNNAR